MCGRGIPPLPLLVHQNGRSLSSPKSGTKPSGSPELLGNPLAAPWDTSGGSPSLGLESPKYTSCATISALRRLFLSLSTQSRSWSRPETAAVRPLVKYLQTNSAVDRQATQSINRLLATTVLFLVHILFPGRCGTAKGADSAPPFCHSSLTYSALSCSALDYTPILPPATPPCIGEVLSTKVPLDAVLFPCIRLGSSI